MFVWLAFFFNQQPILQIVSYVLLSQIQTYFLASVLPYEELRENKSEIFNESIITFIGYF